MFRSGHSQATIKHYLRVYSRIFRPFSIPGIFRNLVYSKVPWYLDPCQTYCSVFGRYFLPIIIFLFLNAPSKTIFNKGLYFDLSIRATQLVHLFQAYLDISKHYSRIYAYSESCLPLTNSESWCICITKHIHTPRYIHNTILNIFTKSKALYLGCLVQF